MSDTKKPSSTITFFPISAAIWRDERGERTYYRTTISKLYKNAENGLSSTTTFDPQDLLLVAKAADQAHTEIEKLKAEDRKARKNVDEAA